MIDELRCTIGLIDSVRYGRIEQLLNPKFNSGNAISLHRPVFYGTPAPSVTAKAFQGIPINLVFKTPKYAYQQKRRIIGSQPINDNQRLQMEPIAGRSFRK